MMLLWGTCCKIYRATGWMTVAMLSFHVIAEVQSQQFSFSLGENRNLLTVIVSFPSPGQAYSNVAESGRVLSHKVSLFSFLFHTFVAGLANSFSVVINYSLLHWFGTWRHLPTNVPSAPPGPIVILPLHGR